MRRPTKNLSAAVARLTKAAEEESLLCYREDCNYGGSIAGDLAAVLQALQKMAMERAERNQ